MLMMFVVFWLFKYLQFLWFDGFSISLFMRDICERNHMMPLWLGFG